MKLRSIVFDNHFFMEIFIDHAKSFLVIDVDELYNSGKLKEMPFVSNPEERS